MTVEEILAAQDAIVSGAQGRELTDDEMTRYEGLETDLGTARRREALAGRHAAARAAVTPVIQTATNTQVDDTLDRAFHAYLQTGQENADLQALRAQSEAIGSAGGFLVPETFRNRIVERLLAFGGIESAAEQLVTSSGETIKWVTNDDTANSGEIVAEGAAPVGGADLVFGEANIGAHSYTSNGASGLPLRVSYEVAQDSAVNLEAMISRKLAMRLRRAYAPHLVTGTGVGQPQGILDGLTGVEGADDLAAPTYADLLHWIHSVDPEYRNSGQCRWAFNDTSLEMIRGITDTNGRPIVKRADDSIATGAGGETLLGYPVTIDQAFPDRTANSATINWGVFGDLEAGYLVRRVRDIQLLVNPYSRMANRQIEYTAWLRIDAVQQDTNAYVAMTGFVA